MQSFLDQAKHNAEFRACLEEKFPDRFYDWKITAAFYEALHYIKALAAFRKKSIGSSHIEICQNIQPERGGSMPINKTAFKSYSALLGYSMSSRYTGITDPTTFEILLKADYTFALIDLEVVKKYIAGQGCPIPGVVLTPRPGPSTR